jgi:hypothetical protein
MPGLVCPDLPLASHLSEAALVRPTHRISDRPADQGAAEVIAQVHPRI